MKKKLFRIGCRYGYRAWVDLSSRSVLYIDYDDPHEGGTIAKSKDGVTECDFSFLEVKEPREFKAILSFKETGELPSLFSLFDKKGHQVVEAMTSWELEWESNKKFISTLESEGCILKECDSFVASEFDF